MLFQAFNKRKQVVAEQAPAYQQIDRNHSFSKKANSFESVVKFTDFNLRFEKQASRTSPATPFPLIV